MNDFNSEFLVSQIKGTPVSPRTIPAVASASHSVAVPVIVPVPTKEPSRKPLRKTLIDRVPQPSLPARLRIRPKTVAFGNTVPVSQTVERPKAIEASKPPLTVMKETAKMNGEEKENKKDADASEISQVMKLLADLNARFSMVEKKCERLDKTNDRICSIIANGPAPRSEMVAIKGDSHPIITSPTSGEDNVLASLSSVDKRLFELEKMVKKVVENTEGRRQAGDHLVEDDYIVVPSSHIKHMSDGTARVRLMRRRPSDGQRRDAVPRVQAHHKVSHHEYEPHDYESVDGDDGPELQSVEVYDPRSTYTRDRPLSSPTRHYVAHGEHETSPPFREQTRNVHRSPYIREIKDEDEDEKTARRLRLKQRLEEEHTRRKHGRRFNFDEE